MTSSSNALEITYKTTNLLRKLLVLLIETLYFLHQLFFVFAQLNDQLDLLLFFQQEPLIRIFKPKISHQKLTEDSPGAEAPDFSAQRRTDPSVA